MECCVNALVTSFKETILAECPGMIKRNETESEYGRTAHSKGSASSGLQQEIDLIQPPHITSEHFQECDDAPSIVSFIIAHDAVILLKQNNTANIGVSEYPVCSI